MTQKLKLSLLFSLMLILLAAPSFAASSEPFAAGEQLTWDAGFDFGSAELRVSGPEGLKISKTFKAGEPLTFSMSDFGGEIPAGSYHWSLSAISAISPEMTERLRAARTDGDTALADSLKAEAGFQSFKDNGSFYFNGVQLIAGGDETEEEPASAQLPTKAQVFATDVVIQGSNCVGLDCVNGESFGFDTLRLKENNLRIHANDTSNSASFPTTDWRIIFNETNNGGANKFSIEDSSAGRTPFTILGGAPNNSLYVDAAGEVGFGTTTPVVSLHAVDGNTPTLRLEQDGSNGFTPQTYDIASNEANFFIRDVTNGSKLFFRSKPGAPEDSIFIAADGDIGLGTDAPNANLNVRESTSNSQQVLLTLQNNGIPTLQMENTSTSEKWNISVKSDLFEITKAGNGKQEFQLTGSGQMITRGTLTVCADPDVGAGCSAMSYPDYVFDEGYDLMPLEELKTFIADNGHLPKVPTVEDVSKSGINMTQLQLRLLEKVEELTLYTLSQQELIEKQGALIDELQKKLAE